MPHFTVFHRYHIFYKLKVCSSPTWIKSVGIIFPAAYTHFIALSHFGNSYSISIFFIIIFVLVICDLDVTLLIVLGCRRPQPWKMVSVIHIIRVLTVPLASCSPLSLPLLRLPIPWDTTVLKLGQLIILPWLLSVQVEGRVICLTLNKKLESIKQQEKYVASRKLDLLCQTASQVVNAKKFEGN